MATTAPRPGLPTRRTSTLSYSSPGLAAGSAATTPLHRKATRLLSANFEDAGTRAALDTLGELEFAEHSDTAGEDKPGKTPDRSSQVGVAKGIRSALKRGGLRKEVDSKMAEASRDFLDAFSEVNDKLSVLQAHLDAMHVCCDEVQSELDKANQGTRYLLEHAEGLRQQRATTTVQQSLIHVFLARFTLTDSELRALASRDVPVGPELFEAMDKTERIRADCRALLSGEAGEGTQAGLDIMEYTSQHLEAGYAKLHKWLTFEARGFAKDVLEVSSTVREAVSRLKSRPEQLSEVLSILGTTRSTSILNLFLDALTRGGPNGLPRPIELHAHDPIRYIGDMLAWLHQAMAGEREFLESLFGTRSEDEVGARRVGEVHALSRHRRIRTGVDGAGALMTDRDRVKKLLDKDLEGCGRPLKIRVQQTIKSQESPIVSYQIATLIHFYKVTMERTVGEDALMCTVLGEIMDHAYEVFFETLRAQGRSLLRFIQPPAAALSAPTQLRNVLSTLREIMTVYATSLLETEASAPPAAEREIEFRAVLDAALDPALDMCTRMAEMRSVEWDRDVFWVNVDEAILSSLEGFGFVAGRRGQVETDEAEHTEKLTVKHHAHLLAECGLEPILTALRTKGKPLTPLSGLPAGSVSSLMAFQQTFSSFLSTLDPLTSPRLSLLPPHLATAVHSEALARLSRAYAELWDAVMDPEEGYEGRDTLLRRSKEEVEMLLVVR